MNGASIRKLLRRIDGLLPATSAFPYCLSAGVDLVQGFS
jgi:hypothetical protein